MELLFESRLEIRSVEGKMYFVQVQPTVHPEPVMEPDTGRPTEAAGISCFGTVLHDGGRYRMWYQAWPGTWDGPNAQLVGYAESEDGFVWQRTDLGLIEFGGQTTNLCDLGLHSPSVFMDPEAPGSHRYRATGWSEKGVEVAGEVVGERGYYTAHSADGLKWTPDASTPRWPSSDVITSIYHPQQRRGIAALKYNHRVLNIPRRSIWEASMRDGEWTDGHSALVPDEFDDVCAVARGFASGDYYGMGMMPAGSGTVGFIWQFRHTLPRTQDRESGVFGPVDVSLAYQAKQGDRWLHLPGRHDFLSHHAYRWLRGGIYTSSGTVEAGGKQYIYFSAAQESHGWYLDNNWQINDRWKQTLIEEGMDRIGLAHWPKERLFGFRADPEGMLTLDLGEIDEPSELALNYKVETGGSIRVELSDVAGHGLDSAVPLTGDHLNTPVAWTGGTKIAPPPGQRVTAKLHMARAEVYAYEVRSLG